MLKVNLNLRVLFIRVYHFVSIYRDDSLANLISNANLIDAKCKPRLVPINQKMNYTRTTDSAIHYT